MERWMLLLMCEMDIRGIRTGFFKKDMLREAMMKCDIPE